MTPTAIQSLLTSVGTVVTSAISWMGSVTGAVTDTPLLLLFVALPLVGLGIGFFKRIIN